MHAAPTLAEASAVLTTAVHDPLTELARIPVYAVDAEGPAALLQSVRTTLTILRPPPRLTISQWADLNRVLSPEASAEPGQWSTDRAAYQREIMDAICDAAVERVVGMFASQDWQV